MKLYYSPGACSLSPHIVLREAGLAFDLEKVDLKTKRTETGADFLAINPKGYVPVLQLDDGSLLTEGPAIVQYLADRVPASKLAPPAGTMERYRLMEWLNFISTEMHKSFGALFNPDTPEAWKTFVHGLLGRRCEFVAGHLAEHNYLMGQTFTVADAYLFTILGWGKWVGFDLGRWPVLQAYAARIADRQAVHAALGAEQLLKD